MAFLSNVTKHFNVFNRNKNYRTYNATGYIHGSKPDRPHLSYSVAKTVLASIYNRIALDVSLLTFRHVRLNDNKRFDNFIEDSLDNCLRLDPNLDQNNIMFFQDLVLSMFDEGHIAVVPVDTKDNIDSPNLIDIYSLRVGKIVEWMPSDITVKLYNDITGDYEEVDVPKRNVAIIENPFYAVMNESNSVGKRLMHKLALLDSIDEQVASGKLDMIIQLPYTLKNKTKREEAMNRRTELEQQLEGSKYGIGYIDGTEKIIQLNRPVENNLLKQIEYLWTQLYSELNITQSIMDGTADEKTLMNYYSRTVEAIGDTIVNEFKRKFLTMTARKQGQDIMYFRDPFKLVPPSMLAELTDKFSRNEVLSSNELRGIIGFKPSDDPTADELRNKNLSVPKGEQDSLDDLDINKLLGGEEE